jgi:hypothetical protein
MIQFNPWNIRHMEKGQSGRGIDWVDTVASKHEHQKTSAAQYFLKGVRRNVADHTKFKEAKQWQRWERHLQSTATAQGVEQVFDPNCVPTTTEDIELFNEKQRFSNKKGMTIVREHSKTKDAQSAHVHCAVCWTSILSEGEMEMK